MMRSPVLFIGPEKTGTTWIQKYLGSRHDVALPARTKETFFFDRFYWRGKRWYLKHWNAAEYAARTPVEVAPSYFFDERVPERVRDFGEPATVVCTLREPVARVVSLYYHRRRAGAVRVPLLKAIRQDRILGRSLHYGPALRRWARAVGRERVKALFFEELRDQPVHFVRDLEAALGWQPCNSAVLPDGAVNEGSLARSYFAAKALRSAAYGLRAMGAYGLIDAGRRMGLKKLLVGSTPLPRERLTGEEAVRLRELLASDLEDVEHFVGRIPAAWKAVDTAGTAS
jgi:hypothetical protein